VRPEKVMVHSGSQTRPGTGSPHPVAIRAAVEATRLKPLVQKGKEPQQKERQEATKHLKIGAEPNHSTKCSEVADGVAG
jgi:hypothetical protein